MLNRLFGNYLVNRGYLNPAQLDDLLETITEYRKNHLRKRHFACNC